MLQNPSSWISYWLLFGHTTLLPLSLSLLQHRPCWLQRDLTEIHLETLTVPSQALGATSKSWLRFRGHCPGPRVPHRSGLHCILSECSWHSPWCLHDLTCKSEHGDFRHLRIKHAVASPTLENAWELEGSLHVIRPVPQVARREPRPPNSESWALIFPLYWFTMRFPHLQNLVLKCLWMSSCI